MQVRFIKAVIDGKLVVSNRKKTELLKDLLAMKFKLFVETPADDTSDKVNAETMYDDVNLENGYDYLLGMKIWSLTMEKVQEMSKLREDKDRELKVLSGKTA